MTRTATPEIQKMEQPAEEYHIISSWCLCLYGIPGAQTSVRNRLRRKLQRHGLYSIDIGGSSYVGPRNEGLDKAVGAIIEELKRKTGIADLVHFIPGDYDQATAEFFRNQVTGSVMYDIQAIEESIGELESALGGDIEILGKDGKPKDLVILGLSRCRHAGDTLDEIDAVASRFAAAEGLGLTAEKMRRKVAQVRAWVQKVEDRVKKNGSALPKKIPKTEKEEKKK